MVGVTFMLSTWERARNGFPHSGLPAVTTTSRSTVISLFPGAMGLDLGFDREGFDLRVVVDSDHWAVETIKANRCRLHKFPEIIEDDIQNVTSHRILEKAGLENGKATVLIGAPPCEPHSTAGKRNGGGDSRADTIFDFIRIINETKPLVFCMEEVKGFLSSSKKHRDFYDRVAMDPKALDPEERPGSFFTEVMEEFRKTGYNLSFDENNPKEWVLNAADYGVPQKRERFILIGVREGPPVSLPVPTHGSNSCNARPRLTLGDVLPLLRDQEHQYLPFPTGWSRFLKEVPQGGCWKDLSLDAQREAMGGAFDDPNDPRTRGKKGGRTGFFRRLAWDQPSPTLVDRPTTKACCLCHPDELRPLSIQEYACIQGFPVDWVFRGPKNNHRKFLGKVYELIGQATPVPLSIAIASTISDWLAQNGPDNSANIEALQMSLPILREAPAK